MAAYDGSWGDEWEASMPLACETVEWGTGTVITSAVPEFVPALFMPIPLHVRYARHRALWIRKMDKKRLFSRQLGMQLPQWTPPSLW